MQQQIFVSIHSLKRSPLRLSIFGTFERCICRWSAIEWMWLSRTRVLIGFETRTKSRETFAERCIIFVVAVASTCTWNSCLSIWFSIDFQFRLIKYNVFVCTHATLTNCCVCVQFNSTNANTHKYDKWDSDDQINNTGRRCTLARRFHAAHSTTKINNHFEYDF